MGGGCRRRRGTDRVAAAWYGYGSAVTMDVNLTDGLTHQLALYVVDWDSRGRAETIEIRDAATNALLDSQTVSGFVGGQYWKWTVRGHVTIRFTALASNAVVSGLFLDAPGSSNPAPVVTLTAPSDGASGVAPANFALTATASDNDGVQKVEFYEGANLIATSTNGTANGATPYTATWSNVPAGSYTVTAKAYDTPGARTVSAAAHVTVTSPGGGATATFMGTDTTTQGNWRGAYGADGYVVVGDTTSYPAYGTVTPSGQATWVVGGVDE